MENNRLQLLVGNISTALSQKLTGDIYEEFKQWLGFVPENAEYIKQNNPYFKGYITTVCYDKGWCNCPVKTAGMHFPTGLISRACEFFKDKSINYEIIDARQIWTPQEIDLSITRDINGKPFSLYDYQKEAVDKSIQAQRGIIKIATGGGKTIILAAIIANIAVKPTVVYVTTIDLLSQMKKDIENVVKFNGSTLTVGQVGGGKKEIQDITVMTVQTAVRALGEKYVKNSYDDEPAENDKTNIDDIKKELCDLIKSAKFVAFDECQHVRAETAQIISGSSISARWKFGLSATPWRDAGDDILIDACFGKPIIDIRASWLIQNNYLVKPYITFVPIRNLEHEKFGDWQNTYKCGVVENDYRTEWISSLSQNLADQGRTVLILVNQINHGEYIKSAIPNSVFIHGSSAKKERAGHIQNMKGGKSSVTIASSLPYNELIIVKHNGMIKQMEIGDLCHNKQNEVLSGKYESLCSKDGKTLSWSEITATHIHKRDNRLVKVRTDKNEEVVVTENHSLIDSNFNQVLPAIGGPACVPQLLKENIESQNEIDVIQTLSKCGNEGVEVIITGINQSRIRKLKSEFKFFNDKNSVSKDTSLRIKKENYPNDYFLALTELFQYSKYYKFRRRLDINDAAKCKCLFKFFDAKIYVRRSRNPAWLPIKIPVTKDLATFFGLMAAEGYFGGERIYTYNGRPRPVHQYACTFTGKVDTTDGKYDKDKSGIRDIFTNVFKKTFPQHKLSFSQIQITCNSKLLYLLFRELGCFDSKKEKRVPDFIYNTSNVIKEHFLWGHYLGDGSLVFWKGNISKILFHTSSRPLMQGIWMLLQMLHHSIGIGFQPAIIEKNTKPRYYIQSRSTLLHLMTKKCVNKRDYTDSNRIQKCVEYLDRNDEYVYDISVKDCHNFIGGTILCHNTIFDEGIDVRPLDTLILAGGGKSSTRALQRIGRVLRKYTYPDGRIKENAFVYDLHDHLKYLSHHAYARRKIYRTEPEFDIKEFKG